LAKLCSNSIEDNLPGGSLRAATSFDEPGWVTLSVTESGVLRHYKAMCHGVGLSIGMQVARERAIALPRL